MKVTVILNEGSGKGEASAAEAVTKAFAATDCEATVTMAHGTEIGAIARRAVEEGANVVVAAGGDGTVSAVATAVAGSTASLGVLPLGTLNHFAKDLRIPLDLPGAVNTIARGRVAAIDLGEVNGHLFVNNASVGIYPRLVLERERQRRQGRRKATARLLSIVQVWRTYRRVQVEIQREGRRRVVRTPFVFVGNNQYQLDGARIGGRLHLDGECLHLCMAPGLRQYEVFRVLLAALVGRLRDLDRFESICLGDFCIDAKRPQIDVSLDGEVLVLETPLRFRISPGRLRVIVADPAGD